MNTKAVFLCAALCAAVSSAHAADYTWTGAVSNEWNNPDNWSPAGVPTSAPPLEDKAIFGPGAITNSPITLGSTDTPISQITYSGAGPFEITSSGGKLVIDSSFSNNFLATNSSGELTINAPLQIVFGAGDLLHANVGTPGLYLNGVVSEGMFPGQGIRKIGGGVLFLNNANTFTGGLNIEANTVRLGHNHAAGPGPIRWRDPSGTTAKVLGNHNHLNGADRILANDLVFEAKGTGGSYRIQIERGSMMEFTTSSISYDDAGGEMIVLIQHNGLGPVDMQTRVKFSGTAINTAVPMRLGTILEILELAPASGTQVWSGNIVCNNAGGQLVKSGAGTVVLGGTGNFAGKVLVDEGTLVVNGAVAGAAEFSVAPGAVIGGAGTIGGATTGVVVSGAVAPGHGGIGTLSTGGSVTWNGGNAWTFELGAGGVSDQLAITGDLLAGTGPSYTFDFQGTGEPGTYTLLTFTGTSEFEAVDFGYTNLANGLSGTFSMTANALQFTIPGGEPPVLVASVAGGALVVTFPSQTGFDYTLEKKSDGLTGTWEFVETKSGTGSDLQFTSVSAPASGQKVFCRVVVTPAAP